MAPKKVDSTNVAFSLTRCQMLRIPGSSALLVKAASLSDGFAHAAVKMAAMLSRKESGSELILLDGYRITIRDKLINIQTADKLIYRSKKPATQIT